MWNKIKCKLVGTHLFVENKCEFCGFVLATDFDTPPPSLVLRFFCFIGLHDDKVYEVLHETERGQAVLVCHECKSCGNIKYE